MLFDNQDTPRLNHTQGRREFRGGERTGKRGGPQTLNFGPPSHKFLAPLLQLSGHLDDHAQGLVSSRHPPSVG